MVRYLTVIMLACATIWPIKSTIEASAVDQFWDTDMPKNIGCGPGNLIFAEDSWLSTFLASSTNMISSPLLPFSTTSKLSGCNSGPPIVENKPAYDFIALNYDKLMIDMAAGCGETLVALAQLLGISENRQEIFWLSLKENYSSIFGQGNKSPGEVYLDIVRTERFSSS